MELQRIALENSALDEGLLKVGELPGLDPLRDSLRRSGQLNPLVVMLRDRGDDILVSGFRRIQALRDIGDHSAMAWVYEPGETSLKNAFLAALAENLSHRELNPLEKARSLAILAGVCEMDREEMVASILPMLGLPAHKNVLRSYLLLDTLSPKLKSLFRDGRLTLATAERLGVCSEVDRNALQPLFERAHWSSSQQRKLLSLIENLAGSGRCGWAEVLEKAGCGPVLSDPALSGFEKGERLYALLYRLGNPRLSAAHASFREELGKLGLPGSVRLSPDPYFETTKIRVEFDASDPESFRLAAEHLARAARLPSLTNLFRGE